jgi:carbon monoxide dehydrogenase subunit G
VKLENSFRVDLPPASAWATLLDIPSVVPCMPGAELLAVEDARTYRGQVKVKLGPVAVAFQGRAKLTDVDEIHRTVRVSASGTEGKGRGSAQADVAFRLSPDGEGTRVDIVSDLALAGAVAQYGRAQGVIADVSQLMVDQFAENLRRHIVTDKTTVGATSSTVTAGATAPASAPELSLFSLLVALVRRWLSRPKEASTS